MIRSARRDAGGGKGALFGQGENRLRLSVLRLRSRPLAGLLPGLRRMEHFRGAPQHPCSCSQQNRRKSRQIPDDPQKRDRGPQRGRRPAGAPLLHRQRRTGPGVGRRSGHRQRHSAGRRPGHRQKHAAVAGGGQSEPALPGAVRQRRGKRTADQDARQPHRCAPGQAVCAGGKRCGEHSGKMRGNAA